MLTNPNEPGYYFDYELAVSTGILSREVADEMRDSFARANAYGSITRNTLSAFTTTANQCAEWCSKNKRVMIPMSRDTIVAYTKWLVSSTGKAATAMTKFSLMQSMHKYCSEEFDKGKEPGMIVTGAQRQGLLAQPSQAGAFTLGDLESLRVMIDVDSRQEQLAVAALSIAAFSFGRVSEVVDYKMSDVTETDYGWTIDVGRRKNDQLGVGSSVEIPWSHVAYIKNWRDKYNLSQFNPILAKEDGTGMTRKWIHIVVRNTTNKYGWSGVTLHSLRAAAAEAALDAGIAPEVIAKAGGWSSTNMVMRYGRRATQASAQRMVHGAIQQPVENEMIYFGLD